MKKILSIAAALVVAAAFISCGDSGDSFDGSVDTVINVESPSVSAKTYPGVIYLTWKPCAQAKSYEVWRTADGRESETVLKTANQTSYADIASSDGHLVDGKTYTYTVIALGDNSTQAKVPSRDVYAKSSKSSVSVKAIVPDLGADVKEFTDSYSKKYFAKFADAASMEKAKVAAFLKNGNIYAKFPTTAGFKTNVRLLNTTKVAAHIEEPNASLVSDGITWREHYLEDSSDAWSSLAVAAGKYQVYLTIASECKDLYSTTAVYPLGSEIEIKSIGEDTQKTANVTAKVYDGKNVTVTWTPAKLVATGKATPTTNYKVYRSSAADNYQTLTQITSATVKVVALGKEKGTAVAADASSDVDDVYGITDSSITEKAVAYKYYVVHTDGTLYGTYTTSGNEGTLATTEWDLTKTTQPIIQSVSIVSTNGENVENTFKVTVKKANQNQTLALGWVKLSDNFNGETINQTFAPDAFTAITLGNPNYDVSDETQYAYFKPAATGTYLFKLTATEKNKADNYAYYVAVMTPAGATVTIGGLTATKVSNADKDMYIKDTELNADTAKLFSYKVVTVDVVYTNAYQNGSVTTTTTFGDAFKLTKVTNDSDAKLKTGIGVGFFGALKAWSTLENSETVTKNRTVYVQKISDSTGAYKLVTSAF
jgi:hypothetical protein